MFASILKSSYAKVALSLFIMLSAASCHREPTEPVPTTPQVIDANRPTDFKGWMKLHENELTSARLAYQVAKAKHILPGQSFNQTAFDADYKAALQKQGLEIKSLPNSARIPDTWNATRQTTAQYLDAHQVKGALKQYILTLEQNLKKSADKLLRDHNATNPSARGAADDEWGPSEEQTYYNAIHTLEHSADNLPTSISYEEREAIWMVTGTVENFLPEFINSTKQQLGFYNSISFLPDGQARQQAALGLFGKLLKRLFNVVATVVIAAATIIVATVAMVAASVYGAPLTGYLGVIYGAVVGRMIGGMYDAIAGNNYICFFPGDGGRC